MAKDDFQTDLPMVAGSTVQPKNVSEEFITALAQTGARSSLVKALREERKSDRPIAHPAKDRR